jgi:uncharacterized protein (TIGR02001 family)
VTARASQPVQGTRKRLAEIVGRAHCGAILATILLCSAAPASAQVGAAVSLLSDDRFRGFSLSDGHPVAALELSYDSPTGFYAAASGTLVGSAAEGARPLGLQLEGGYAAQVSSGLTAEAGIVHARYSRYSGLRSGLSYTEVYAGLEGKTLSSRVYFSPRYLGRGATAYGELNAALPLGGHFTFQGHAGLFVPLYAYSRGSRSLDRYDWQLGVSRPVGRLIFHAALGGGGPRQYYYGDYSAGHTAIFGVDYAL